jgi:hypothetical protein
LAHSGWFTEGFDTASLGVQLFGSIVRDPQGGMGIASMNTKDERLDTCVRVATMLGWTYKHVTPKFAVPADQWFGPNGEFQHTPPDPRVPKVFVEMLRAALRQGIAVWFNAPNEVDVANGLAGRGQTWVDAVVDNAHRWHGGAYDDPADAFLDAMDQVAGRAEGRARCQ